MTVSPEESDPTTASDTHAHNPPHKVCESGDVISPYITVMPSSQGFMDSWDRKPVNILPIVRRRKRSSDWPGRLDNPT